MVLPVVVLYTSGEVALERDLNDFITTWELREILAVPKHLMGSAKPRNVDGNFRHFSDAVLNRIERVFFGGESSSFGRYDWLPPGSNEAHFYSIW